LNKAAIAAVALTTFGILAAAPAQAQSTSFAAFTLVNTNNTPFIFTDNGATGDTLRVVNEQVRFSFGSEQVLANFNYSANVGSGAAGANNLFAAALTNVNFSFIGLDGTNLLSATSSTGQIVASGGSGGMNGSDTNSVATDDTVNFTSSIFDFSNTSERSFAFTLTAINPGVTNANPGSFVASGAGSFSSNPSPTMVAVPEANAGLLAGLALPIIGGVAVLRRRKK
jgi:hypothetical protein